MAEGKKPMGGLVLLIFLLRCIFCDIPSLARLSFKVTISYDMCIYIYTVV